MCERVCVCVCVHIVSMYIRASVLMSAGLLIWFKPGLGRSSGMNSSCEFEKSNCSRTRGGGFGELYTPVAISDQKSTEID